MNCCTLDVTDNHFSTARVQKKLEQYLEQGPAKTTKILLEALKEREFGKGVLLDIGAGLGPVSLELCANGVSRAVLVEMSAAFIAAATEQARQRDVLDRLEFIHGDFVNMAEQLPEADLVVLDRVVCCYPEVEPLVTLAAAKCREVLALSYPRDVWYMRLDEGYRNWRRRRNGNFFETFVHSEEAINAPLKENGFDRFYEKKTFGWKIVLYRREDAH